MGAYYFNRGIVYSRKDMVQKAVDDYSKALNGLLSEPDHQYQAYFNRGICYRRLGPDFLDDSIKDLTKAVGMKNDRPSVHNNLGLSYFEKGNFEEALTYYAKAISLEPSAVHYNNRGLAHYHINNLREALEDFKNAIKFDPNDPTIIFNRGNVYLNWQDKRLFEEAHADYDRAIEIDPGNAKLYHAKGLAFEGEAEELKAQGADPSERNQRAIEMYQKALKLQENFISSRFHLGLMYHKTN
jgi:tetratricopeptide (TPR) repeat protein